MKGLYVLRSSILIMVGVLLSSCTVPTSSDVVCPDGESECPDDFTCCLMNNDKYGCCPLPNAVCCSDHEHCCPNGFKCNIAAGSCYEEAGSENGKATVPATTIKNSKLVKCNNTVACPDGSTCCKTSDGFKCCHLQQAVCCSDGKYCCPSGWECLETGKCKENKHAKPSQKLVSGKDYKAVECPDGRSECPDGNTCCKLASGQYGCCPLPKAVCCSDHVHCCPNGYTCDVSSGTCNRGLSSIPFVKKVPSTPTKKVGNVICPGGKSYCPDGNTCCKLASGQYGCCPLPKAVCCSDHVHCCPNGYTCNVSNRTCSRGSSSMRFVKVPLRPLKKEVKSLNFDLGIKEVGNVICPDGQSQCPDGNTCCKLASGQYGCCPLPEAVCCSDHVHCCPNGYTCDVSSGTCNRGLSSIPFVKKVPSTPIKKEVGNVICPDGQSQCPDGNTCCKLASGQYGCCPLPEAVCCSDHVHCCPNGYTCDVSSGTCNRGLSSIPFVKKVPSTPTKKVGNVICPGGKSYCPDGNTCCKLASGQYGCCPLPKAVCCSDHVHCCPNGYTCDVSNGTCRRGLSSIPFVMKVQSKRLKKEVESLKSYLDINNRMDVKYIRCPDGSMCSNYETCCLHWSGWYGCCPFPYAVCCPDYESCCPYGSLCDLYSATCFTPAKTLPMIPHYRTSLKSKSNDVTDCPDGSNCNSGETCCEEKSGKYGCCPLPFAVCCPDKQHCCPSGFTCDDKTQKCQRGNSVIPMLSKRVSKRPVTLKHLPVRVPKIPTVIDDVVRFVPRGRQCQCGLHRTCCVGSEGQQYCCPLPNASCCADGLHCCPEGFTCDNRKGCVRN